jgi:hypothetical protein
MLARRGAHRFNAGGGFKRLSARQVARRVAPRNQAGLDGDVGYPTQLLLVVLDCEIDSRKRPSDGRAQN